MTAANKEPEAGREWPLAALVFIAVATGLIAVLVNLLNYHNYPLIRAEVALLFAVMALIAAAATGLHRLAQPRLSFMLTGIFAAILIDLGTDPSRPVFLAFLVGLPLLARLSERVVLLLTIAGFGTALLFQMAGLVTDRGPPATPPNEAQYLQDKSPGREQLPPIIHLVLDAYIGPEGMSAAGTNFGGLRQQQERFYQSHGFQLYPQAYSRHAKTINSLPELLSYGQARRATEPRDLQYTVAPPLNYFTDLDRKGYATSVLTPSFVDFCPSQPLTRCHNYNRSDLSAMIGSNLSAADRARIIGATMLELSPLTALISGMASLRLSGLLDGEERHLFNRGKLYSLSGFKQLDAFSRDLATLEYGEVRFAHLLLPHDPFMLDAGCRLLPEPDWIDEHGPSSFADRDAAYARQTQCMTEHNLKAMLAALDMTAAGRAAIVIVQGDHGSRTVDGVPGAGPPGVGAPGHSSRTMLVTHSTLFAIRVPGQQAVTVNGRVALDELLGGFAATGFSAAPRPDAGPAEVYLMDNAWIPRKRVALPPTADTHMSATGENAGATHEEKRLVNHSSHK